MRFNLGRSVFYRTYFDELYLYDTRLQKSYVFNAVAADIVSAIGTNPGIYAEDIASLLSNEYQVEEDVLCKDVEAFIDTMLQKGILQSEVSLESPSLTKERLQTPPFEEQIQQKLQMATGSKVVLLAALLELTYRCNQECIHCYAINNGEPASKELSI